MVVGGTARALNACLNGLEIRVCGLTDRNRLNTIIDKNRRMWLDKNVA